MKTTFMPNIRSQEELQFLQLEGLKWTVKHAYENSNFFKRHFDKYGINPEDIKALDDLTKLPFTQASDLQEGYPFPLLSVPFEKVVRIHASSGTTGKRKVMAKELGCQVYTAKELGCQVYTIHRCHP